MAPNLSRKTQVRWFMGHLVRTHPAEYNLPAKPIVNASHDHVELTLYIDGVRDEWARRRPAAQPEVIVLKLC
jgi:hypothetical protein